MKLTRIFLIIALALSPLTLSGCGKDKTAQNKLAIFTAQADAALIAFSDTVAVLQAAGKTQTATAKNIYAINLRAAKSIAILRDRAEAGFQKAEALTIINEVIADVRKAESDGVVNLTGKNRETFLKVTFFAQFTLASIKAVIEATKEPTVPTEEVKAAAAGRAGVRAQGDETVWTDIVLILQNAVLRGISLSRLSAADAFSEGRMLSGELIASLNARLAA